MTRIDNFNEAWPSCRDEHDGMKGPGMRESSMRGDGQSRGGGANMQVANSRLARRMPRMGLPVSGTHFLHRVSNAVHMHPSPPAQSELVGGRDSSSQFHFGLSFVLLAYVYLCTHAGSWKVVHESYVWLHRGQAVVHETRILCYDDEYAWRSICNTFTHGSSICRSLPASILS